MSVQAFPPLEFPSGALPGLLCGLTPPMDSAGSPLDLSRPSEALGSVQRTYGAAGWPAYWLRQVHGREIAIIDRDTPVPSFGGVPEADALMTDVPGVLLLTRHADCPPVLLWDPVRRAVALVHSGRQGTIANIAGETVRRMAERYGSRASDLVGVLGPGIRACCYQVREDVLPGGEERDGLRPFLHARDSGLYLDLQAMVAHQLRSEGVERVIGGAEAECTCCGPTGLHSYRRDATRLRFAAVAGIRH